MKILRNQQFRIGCCEQAIAHAFRGLLLELHLRVTVSTFEKRCISVTGEVGDRVFVHAFVQERRDKKVAQRITGVDFSIRMQAYEQAPSLQKFDFQPMKISFEFVDEKQFTEVLYLQSIYDLIDFSLRKCVQEKIMMRTCKNCGKYFALTVHGSTEYCSRVFDGRGRTCKEVGAMRQYMQSHAQDELLKIYRREYKRRFAWIRAGKISQEAFSAWSREAQKEKEKCENGEISQGEFEKWLKQLYSSAG